MCPFNSLITRETTTGVRDESTSTNCQGCWLLKSIPATYRARLARLLLRYFPSLENSLFDCILRFLSKKQTPAYPFSFFIMESKKRVSPSNLWYSTATENIPRPERIDCVFLLREK